MKDMCICEKILASQDKNGHEHFDPTQRGDGFSTDMLLSRVEGAGWFIEADGVRTFGDDDDYAEFYGAKFSVKYCPLCGKELK